MKKSTTYQRQKREKQGRWAECFACAWLGLKGYRILERRARLKSGEIDIIASKNKTIVFVEVKARSTLEKGLQSVSASAWQRIGRSAEIWMSHHQHYFDYAWRYDLIVVLPRKWPRHFRSHWRP